MQSLHFYVATVFIRNRAINLHDKLIQQQNVITITQAVKNTGLRKQDAIILG
jgi:hypothetical protein